MNQINYLDKEYLVPSKPMELGLEQFIDLYSLLKGKETMTEEQVVSLLHIITSIPHDIIKEMKEVTIAHLYEELKPVLALSLPAPEWKQTIKKEQASFTLGDGETYLFQPHYGFSKLGVIRGFEDWFGQTKYDVMDYLHYIIAICARSQNEVFDPNTLHLKARMVLDSLKLEDCYHPIFYFLKTRTELLTANEALFSKEKPKSAVDEHGNKRSKLDNSPSKQIISRWGWYHVSNRLIENGTLAKTMDQMDGMTMIQVFEQLSYLHDMRTLQEAESKRKQQMVK